jgi:hypothetical protein
MRHLVLKKGTGFFTWLTWGIVVFGFQFLVVSEWSAASTDGTTTVLFYMNGDNDLTDEVLSAVDRMETVGSTATLNIVALVDGHPDGISRFGSKWMGTRLLHITPDNRTARINSKVLADWGERDMGNPDTLSQFIRDALELFPAERYIFCAFAHGKGVIDTGRLVHDFGQKSLSISSDATSHSIMSLTAFKSALETGLNGHRFSLTILFSCLSGMVEIAYSLGDVTDYLIASEDEIRLVNDPPGTHQLRGISFEDLLRDLKSRPRLSVPELGRRVVDRFVDPYHKNILAVGAGGGKVSNRYSAGLALIDCIATARLVAALDELAGELINHLNHPETVLPLLVDLQLTLKNTPTFKSFLNLEYYDLFNFLEHMARTTADVLIREKSTLCATLLKSEVVRYERHTPDAQSHGVAIFFGHYLVPENVFAAHNLMYRRTRFSRRTRWDELIQTYRTQMRLRQSELLLYHCKTAYRQRDIQKIRRLSQKAVRMFSRQMNEGRIESAREIINFLTTLPQGVLSTQLLSDLENLMGDNTDSQNTTGISRRSQRLERRERSN